MKEEQEEKMAADYIFGKTALAAFAVICAWQDIRTMSISHRVVSAGLMAALLGLLAAVYAGCRGAGPDEMYRYASMCRDAAAHMGLGRIGGVSDDVLAAVVITAGTAAGCIPGLILLTMSHMTGQIGAGDGLYFIIAGAMTGLRDVILLLLLALFINAWLSIGILVWSKMAEIRETAGLRRAAELRETAGTGMHAKIRGAAGTDPGRPVRTKEVLKKKLPFLPAASAVLMWMLVRR